MFRKAFAIASGYTFPVVLSRKDAEGKCSSGIGSYVVVNEDGWIVTAAHILKQLNTLSTEECASREHYQKVEAIRSDASLDAKERGRKLKQLGKIDPGTTDRCSAWWGPSDESRLVEGYAMSQIDLAVGRLEPFDKSMVKNYPIFKDPTKDFDPGTSLCKLGFPFHSITPIWHDDRQAFELPPGSTPLPFFPIDGIFTRTAIAAESSPETPYPLQLVETSSPGLRGQSGGPIFDVNGAIWAIQCITQHWPLGFNPPVPGKPGQVEHQFLNVGLGVHPSTLFGFMDKFKVKYHVSDY